MSMDDTKKKIRKKKSIDNDVNTHVINDDIKVIKGSDIKVIKGSDIKVIKGDVIKCDDDGTDVKGGDNKVIKSSKIIKSSKVIKDNDDGADVKGSDNKVIKSSKIIKSSKVIKGDIIKCDDDGADVKGGDIKVIKGSDDTVIKGGNGNVIKDGDSKVIKGSDDTVIKGGNGNVIKDGDSKVIKGDIVDTCEQYNAIFKKNFGYDALKHEQYEIISNIINNKRDVSAVLSTGYGKSACYQLPILITKKSVIVICPLIALMNEQCAFLKEKGIPVCIFNGDTPKKERDVNEYELLKGNYKLIYMTPEYFVKSEVFIKKLYDKNNLLMVCIDEAHAVSTWGLDFRPSYTKLGVIKEWIDIPILTLTATASTKVKEDIKNILKLNNPLELIGNFDRPNLFIKVLPRKDNKSIIDDLAPLLKKYKNEYIIIYCTTRDETEKVAEIINNYGISCFAYHAGLNTEIRNDTQQKFNDGIYKCIVATIAFGMGINIPNVRLVIHNNCPKNMESYYQEIGRAGRDGLPAECCLFYSNKDFVVNRFFLKNMTNLEYKAYQEDQLRNIEKYVYTADCRRKLILKNFNQSIISCSNCDNCLKVVNTNKKINYIKQTYLLLSLIKRINDKFGTGTVINVLLGKNKVKDYLKTFDEFNKGTVFGKEDWWKLFVRTLINNDLIIEKQVSGAFGSTIGLTSNGLKLINTLKTSYEQFTNITATAVNSECMFNCIGGGEGSAKATKNKIIIDAFEELNSVNQDDLYDLLS
jgi:RecQ family ATP-dependent DNA helicase